MSNTATPVQIPVGLDKEAFDRGIKELQDTFNGSLTNMNAAVELAGKAWDVVAGAVSYAVGHVVQFAKASADAELAERRAFVAMNERGKVTREAFDALKEFNGALQQKAGIDADDLLKVQGTLAALGVMPGKMQEATLATIGLSEATGKELSAAAVKVAKDIEKGGTHVQLWGANVAIAEDRAKTLAGQLQLLSINSGDLEESLGGAVTQSSAAAEAMQALNGFVAELANLFAREDVRLAVDGFFRQVAGGLSMVIDMTVGAIKAFRAFASEARVSFEFAMGADFVTEAITPTDELLDALLEKATNLSDRLAAISHGSAALLTLSPPTAQGGSGGGGKAAATPTTLSLTEGAIGDQTAYQRDRTKVQMQRIALEANLRDQELKAKEKWDQQQLSYDRQVNETRFQEQLAAYQRLEAASDRFNQNMVAIGVGGFADFFTGLTVQIAQGNVDVEALMGKFLGTVLSQFGTTLISMGSGAVAAGVLGTVAPIFGVATGGPAGVAAGLGLIAAGGAMVGLGSLLGGAAGGGGGGSTGAGSGAGGRVSSSTPRFAELAGGPPVGFSTGGGAQSTTNVWNVRFERGVVVGRDEASVARELDRIQRRGERLRGGGRR